MLMYKSPDLKRSQNVKHTAPHTGHRENYCTVQVGKKERLLVEGRDCGEITDFSFFETGAVKKIKTGQKDDFYL